MGTRISVDKHTSRLEDILDTNPKLLEKVKFDSTIPDCITQHIKIWKFSDDQNELMKVQIEPINLSLIQSSGFNFMSNECYLVLLVYRKSHQDDNLFLSFPHQMWGIVESYSNLTPRGLQSPLAASDKEIFDSFLLPKRDNSGDNEFEYMIFAWNGKTANPLVKAQALSNAFELENLLNKGKDPFLQILFSGGVIRNKKLQKGSIMQFSSEATQPISYENQGQAQHARETVYLFNFLFPEPRKQREYSRLSDFLAQRSQAHVKNPYATYQSRFRKAQADIPEDEKLKSPQSPQNTVRNKVPSLNFKQLPIPQEKTRVPKFDLNLKNVSQEDNVVRKELDVGVPLIEGVEYSEMKAINAMKLPLGKLGVREETTYQDIAEEEQTGFNFDIRDTDRKKLKIKYFSEICSEVIKDFLYVGGESIASNREVLEEIGVTHVVNCAGDVCQNKFPDQFSYTTYYLKDSKTENIECIFYEVINHIEDVFQSGGKVLIHCVQGVSRSVSLCIAYLILKQKLTYSLAFDHIKKVRGVASPNMGFTVQLLLFQKRLQGPYDTIPVIPRVFAISRGVSGNNNVVCRMLMDQLFAGKSTRTFDSRGVFLIQSEDTLYIWIGPECNGDRQSMSVSYAKYYSNILKQHESAPQMEPILLRANDEPQNFWQLWGFSKERPQILCQRVKEWDGWYDQIDEEQFQLERKQIQQMYSTQPLDEEPVRPAETQRVSSDRPKLFVYPNCDGPLGVFDLEDLDSQQLCLLFKILDDALQVYIWRGLNWEGNDDDERNFVDEVISSHFRHFSHENIFIYKEEPNEETEEFLDCFQ